MLSEIRPAVVSTVFFTLLLGLGYPLLITGVSHIAFPIRRRMAASSEIHPAKWSARP